MKKYILLFFLLSLILILTLSCRRDVSNNQDNSDYGSDYNKNSLGIIVKASGKDLLLFVQDRITGKALGNVKLHIPGKGEIFTISGESPLIYLWDRVWGG